MIPKMNSTVTSPRCDPVEVVLDDMLPGETVPAVSCVTTCDMRTPFVHRHPGWMHFPCTGTLGLKWPGDSPVSESVDTASKQSPTCA
jgi:hypothetical protein